MEQVPRQQYTKEFREQAVRLVLAQQVTIPEAARRLTMSGRTLERWVGRARQGRLTTLGGEPLARDRTGGRVVPTQTGTR